MRSLLNSFNYNFSHLIQKLLFVQDTVNRLDLWEAVTFQLFCDVKKCGDKIRVIPNPLYVKAPPISVTEPVGCFAKSIVAR